MKNISVETEINKIEKQVCPSCGLLIDFNTTFCSNCNAPISLLSNVDPLQTIRAEGVLYRRMTERKPKIIVITGSWLLFFPGVVGGLFLIATTIIQGIGGGFGAFLLFWIGVIIFAVSSAILFRVTRNYFVLPDTKSD